MGNLKHQAPRIACAVLGVLLAFRLVMIFFRSDPLSRIQIPPVPHWLPTNAVVAAATNSGAPTKNQIATNLGTNSANVTNTLAPNQTNQLTATNQLVSPTNQLAMALTNSVSDTNTISGTNLLAALTNSPAATTNPPGNPLPPGIVMAMGGPPGMPRGMRPGMMPGMPGMGPRVQLPPLEQARVDKIVQSELLAPIVRPMPMALLGIVGPDAFIRTPNGQKVILREGGAADGLKVLRIGTNRVLIELAGESKELMIFAGRGGESLLPKPPAAKP